MARYYFLSSSLPPMPIALGEKLALPFSEMCRLIMRNIESEDEPLVHSCLLAIDTANMVFFLQGQDIFLPGGSLTREEIEGKRHLPSFIKTFLEDGNQQGRRVYGYDNLWEAYYGYAFSLSMELNCRFLIDYLTWEIGLRNSLAGLRAKARGEDAEDYQIMVRAGGYDFSPIITQLKTLQNPLKAEQFLDEERLKRIYHCEGPDPFSRDTILGALERAKIYSRWEKLTSIYQVHDII